MRLNAYITVAIVVAGLKVTYDLTKPEGSRVVHAEARCGYCLLPKYEPLNLTAEYSIIMSEYLYQGGDGFDMFANITVTEQDKLGEDFYPLTYVVVC